VKGDSEEVGEELTINIAPRSSRTPVLQICGVVEFASLNGVRGATALGIADAGVGS
jgi:hypothetical protein